MAAAGGAPVRLRLHFDFPPPGSPGCALCWLLLEPGHARLVTDLVSLIRHRFGFSRRARLSLFLEGALLPPTESARLVRDNDALRVKLEEIAGEEEEEESGSTAKWDRERRKRRRKDEGFSRKEEKRHKREKKKKKRSPERSSWREETSADVSDSRRKQKKRKRAEGTGEQSPAGPRRVVAAEGTATTRTAPPQHGEGGLGSSSSTDSDSTEPGVQHGAQRRAQHRAQPSTQHKPRTAAALSQDRAPSAAGMHGRGAGSAGGSDAASTAKAAGGADAQESLSSSSDSDSSSGVEAAAPAQSSTAQALPRSAAAAQSGARAAPTARSSSSSSSESDSADPQTPAATKPPANAALSNPAASSSCRQPPSSAPGAPASPGRGRGRGAAEGSFWRAPRGRGFRGAMRGRGWGRAGGPGFCNYSSEGPKQGLFRGTVTKASVPVQNAVEVPKRDYSVLPLLAAPPQVGERIAFKRLELTENYSPEVSDYKEGRIISWNAEKKQIELEILSSSASPIAKEPGKFDLVYQSADGAELIEYAVPQDTKITESWDALIEPRLIVEPPVNGSGIENGTA